MVVNLIATSMVSEKYSVSSKCLMGTVFFSCRRPSIWLWGGGGGGGGGGLRIKVASMRLKIEQRVAYG